MPKTWKFGAKLETLNLIKPSISIYGHGGHLYHFLLTMLGNHGPRQLLEKEEKTSKREVKKERRNKRNKRRKKNKNQLKRRMS